MIRKIILTSLLFISPWSVLAQECNPPYEMVTRLHKPEPGAYTVWNSVYGEPKYDEEFSSLLSLSGGSVLAVGSRVSVLTGIGEVVFVTFDRLGRKTEERFFALKGLVEIVKVHKRVGGGYAVLANIRSEGTEKIWLGFFDGKQKLEENTIFMDDRDQLSATDFIPSVNLGWVISVSSRRSFGEGRSRVDIENGRIFLVDALGVKIQERSYSPGGNNHISGLSVLKRKGEMLGYIATGYFVNNSGKQIAWSLRLDPNLSLNWQSEYSRGLLAKLKVSYSYLDDYILAFGDVLPANGNSMGTWLALLDADDGRVLWQRYYYGEGDTHMHSANGLFVNDDNLIVVMMKARSLVDRVDTEGPENALLADYVDYAHLLTLSPRGILLGGDTYFFGQGVHIEQLIQDDDGARIMAGYVYMAEDKKDSGDKKLDQDVLPLNEKGRIFLPDAALSSKAKKGLELLQKKIGAQELSAHNKLANREGGLMKKGWVVVGDKLDTYNDPCSK